MACFARGGFSGNRQEVRVYWQPEGVTKHRQAFYSRFCCTFWLFQAGFSRDVTCGIGPDETDIPPKSTAKKGMRWIKIFESAEEAAAALPLRQPQAMLIETRALCLVRTESRIFALSDRCTHNGERLSKGRINTFGEIICPWHGYRFQLGTGRECSQRSRDAETFPVREAPDGIFLGM